MDVISDLASGGWRSVFHMPPPAPNCLSHSAPGVRWYWGGHIKDVWRISSFVLVVVGGKFCILSLYSFMEYCRTHQTAYSEVLWFREEHSESGDHAFIAQTYIECLLYNTALKAGCANGSIKQARKSIWRE